MAAIAWTDVVALPGAARLATLATIYQDVVLAMVNTRVAVDGFDGEDGPLTKLARMYLAAHQATLGLQKAPGALTGERAGGIDKTFAAPMIQSEFAVTPYGMLYLTLVRTSPGCRLPLVV
jgi:hypothetical protein